MYLLINEDNTLVNEYPAPEIYKTMSDKEKENIFKFKEEIEKITLKERYGKITVKVDYDGSFLIKFFVIKNLEKRPLEENDKVFDKILTHLDNFAITDDLLEFYNNLFIILE